MRFADEISSLVSLQGGALREIFSSNLARGPAAGRSAARKLLVWLASEVLVKHAFIISRSLAGLV